MTGRKRPEADVRRNSKNSVQISILGKQDVLHPFVDHFLKNAETVEVLRAVVVLDMDHHDVVHARLVVDSFQAIREHVVGTDDLNLLFLGVTAPGGEPDIFPGDAFNEEYVRVSSSRHQTFGVRSVSPKGEYTPVRFSREPVRIGML